MYVCVCVRLCMFDTHREREGKKESLSAILIMNGPDATEQAWGERENINWKGANSFSLIPVARRCNDMHMFLHSQKPISKDSIHD